MQNITILGSTGTIGQQTLDVIQRHAGQFKVFALAANASVEALYAQVLAFEPQYAVLLNADAASQLEIQLKQAGSATQVLAGADALDFVSAHDEVHIVMAAIVGAAGLKPAMAAAQAGKRVTLANKETLVMSGILFMQAVKQNGATLLPIDSEHNAIFQVMPQDKAGDLTQKGIKRVLLTASGGPFRTLSHEALHNVTVAQALNHPNWKMGPKITIDSATLMNKGLEVIEAHWLFDAPADKIEVVVHPQSVIHSMVEYIDGSILAQMGNPDMRTPIAYALGYPNRLASGVGSLDLIKVGRLDFEPADTVRFPCLALAFDALKRGGTAPAILNAANEIAVAAFLNEQITFMQIPQLISQVLSQSTIGEVEQLADVISADEQARALATEWVATHV